MSGDCLMGNSVVPGCVLRGTYRLERKLGAGWAGEVWLAEVTRDIACRGRTLTSGHRVAAKIYNQHVLSDRGEIGRIVDQLTIAQSVTHEGLVTIYDAHCELDSRVSSSSSAFLIMELAETTLGEIYSSGSIVNHETKDVLYDLRLFREIVEGVQALHFRNVIHWDLKPTNILLTRDSRYGRYHAKVADIGIVCLDRSRESAGWLSRGLRYQAPEVSAAKENAYSVRTDLYSLGAILYLLLHEKELGTDEDIYSGPSARSQGGSARVEKSSGDSLDLIVNDLSRLTECLLATDPRHRLTSTGGLLTGLSILEKLAEDLLKAQSPPEDLIREFDSLLFGARRGEGTGPLYLPRREVFGAEKPSGWSYGAVVFASDKSDRPGPTLRVEQRREADGFVRRCILQVDLSGDEFAIFNSLGEEFLREGLATDDLLKAGARVERFLNDGDRVRSRFSWVEDACKGCKIPLRWTSGGALPIAHSEGRDWAVLFFRDMPPGGWNLANGASEREEELVDVGCMIRRESSEEVILLSTQPEPLEEVTQFVLDFSDSLGVSVSDLRRHAAFTEFYQRGVVHRQLRKQHDGVQIMLDEGCRRQLVEVTTPFIVEVVYQGRIRDCGNVIFSINPVELGIEIIKLYRFELKDDEWIIDGETVLSRPSKSCWLARRPVMLIDIDYLYSLYRNRGELGQRAEWNISPEGRMLPPIPKESFKLMTKVSGGDVDMRKARLRCTSNGRATQDEQDYIRNWLIEFGSAFLQASGGTLSDHRLRTLCPVTWRTLTTAFRHNCLPLSKQAQMERR